MLVWATWAARICAAGAIGAFVVVTGKPVYRPLVPAFVALIVAIAADELDARFLSPTLAAAVTPYTGRAVGCFALETVLDFVGLVLGCVVAVAAFCEVKPWRIFAAYGGAALVCAGLLMRGYPNAWISRGDGRAYAFAAFAHVAFLPACVAFWHWTRKRRGLRVEHWIGLAFGLSHGGMLIGPYAIWAPDPYALHPVYGVVLYGTACVIAVFGAGKWALARS